jgi:hypothetical protein
MVDPNYKDKINEIKSILTQLSKRILTLFGKITVIKTLALSKINHILADISFNS